MPGRTAGGRSVQGPIMTGRCWLTAKGYRYLGHPVPEEVQDDEVVVLREMED